MIKTVKRLCANNWAHSHNYAIKALTGLVLLGSTENRAQRSKQFADDGLIYAGRR